jgi:hypothetical protein
MHGFSRRLALASAASAASAMATAATARAKGLAWDDPSRRLDAIVRMTGRTDGGVAVRWTDGVLTAHVGAETTPLFRVLSQIFSRHRKRADGGFDAVIVELVYFADLATRALLETWRNPFTGETVVVPQTTLGPTRLGIPLSLIVEREPLGIPDAKMEHRFEIEDRGGDDVWVTEHNASLIPSPTPGAPPFGFHETFTFHASARDLADASRAHVPTTVQKSNVLSWRPWMNMGEHPGLTMTRGHGRVLDDLGDLPPHFTAFNAAHAREIVDDLDTYLAL